MDDPIVLQDGPRLEYLRRDPQSLESRVEVLGKLNVGKGSKPTSMKVTDFKRLE